MATDAALDFQDSGSTGGSLDLNRNWPANGGQVSAGRDQHSSDNQLNAHTGGRPPRTKARR